MSKNSKNPKNPENQKNSENSKTPREPKKSKSQKELEELEAINRRIYEEHPEFDPERIDEYPNDEKIRALEFIEIDELLPFWNWKADEANKKMRGSKSSDDVETNADENSSPEPPFKKFVIFQISNNRFIHPEKIASTIATRENFVSKHISPAARLQITEKIAKIAAEEEVGEINNSKTFGKGYSAGNFIVACAVLNDELYTFEKEEALQKIDWYDRDDGTPFKKDNSEIIAKKSRFAYLDGTNKGITIFNCELNNQDYTLDYGSYWARAITKDRKVYRINRIPNTYTDFFIDKNSVPNLGIKNARVRYLGSHVYNESSFGEIGTLVAYELCDPGFHDTTIEGLRKYFDWKTTPAGGEYTDYSKREIIFNAAKEVAELYAGTPIIILRRHYGTYFVGLEGYNTRLAVFNARYTNVKNEYSNCGMPYDERHLGIRNAFGDFIGIEPGENIIGIETKSDENNEKAKLETNGYCKLRSKHIYSADLNIAEHTDLAFDIYAINHKDSRVEIEKVLRKIGICDSYNPLANKGIIVKLDEIIRNFTRTYHADNICFAVITDNNEEYVFGIAENSIRFYNAHHIEDSATNEWHVNHNWITTVTTTGDKNREVIKLVSGKVADFTVHR